MMIILHLHTELNLACGITRTIFQIVSNSSESSMNLILTLGGNALNRFEINDIKVNVLNYNRNTISGSLSILFAIFKYCKKNSVQIVHSHHRYFDTLVWILKPFLKIKTITSVQSKVSGFKLFSYKAQKLIACSKSIKKHLINNFSINKSRITVIYNAVETKEFVSTKTKAELINELNIPPDKFIIGYFGRLDFNEKGIDVLLSAFEDLSKTNSEFHLLLIGDGPNNQEVKGFCVLHKTNATFLSSKENIFDYYKLINLFVLPSKVDPFPLTMLEAGFMNCPFIGSNVDGIAELIENENDGLLFNAENVDELKNQISRIYNDRKLGEKLAENLHKKVLNSFTADKTIPQYQKLYSELLIE